MIKELEDELNLVLQFNCKVDKQKKWNKNMLFGRRV